MTNSNNSITTNESGNTDLIGTYQDQLNNTPKGVRALQVIAGITFWVVLIYFVYKYKMAKLNKK